MEKYSPGDIIEGKVESLQSYGAFIALEDGIIGLLHISEISYEFIEDINNYVKIGEVVKVKILDIDYKEKKAKLSRKALNRNTRYKRNKINFADEKINAEMEFQDLLEKKEELISDAKKRLLIED